jgi:tetratricopeptide (TPR) repeat protein
VVSELYREALQHIREFEEVAIDRSERLRIEILGSRCLTGLGEFNEAFRIASSVFEEARNNREQKITMIESLLEVAAAAWGLGRPDELLQACWEAERIREELKRDEVQSVEFLKADILYHESLGWYQKGDVHKGIDCARESLVIREGLGDIEGVVSSLMRVGYLHLEVDSSQTLDYHEKALGLNKQLDRKRHVIESLMSRGLADTWEGNWDEAEQLLQQGMNLVKESDIGYWLIPGLFCLGLLYVQKGDFHSAEEFFQDCYSASEKVESRIYIALCSNNLGEIHRARGDFKKALRCYERSMDINKIMGRTKGYLAGLANCGLVHQAMGQPDKALALLEESLALAEEQEEAGFLGGSIITYTILYITSILVDKGMVNDARQSVERLRAIKETTKGPFDEHVYRIAAALVLKSSMLPRSRVMAKEHLTEVVDGSFFHHETNTLALLHLTELLVDELQITGEAEAVENLNVRLSKLLDLAAEQKSTLLLVETLLLQSKMALLQLEADKANRLLNEAQSLAEQKGLENLSERIIEEQNALLNELTIWEKLGEEKPPITERTEKMRLHEQIGAMIQQGVWRKMLF